jgi:hypothetical protein
MSGPPPGIHFPPTPAPPANRTPGGFYRPGSLALVARAASIVGLLGSSLGQGPLLEVAGLSPAQTPAPPVSNPVAVRTEEAAPLARRPMNDPGPSAPDFSSDAFTWGVPLLLGAGLVIGVGVAISRAAKGAAVVGRIRIVALPPGEAPEEIRRAWIGVELPTASTWEGGPSGVVGVLSNRAAGDCEGYAVDAEAVSILAAKVPAAAAWWHRNAPHVLAGGYQLVFPAEVCERVG